VVAALFRDTVAPMVAKARGEARAAELLRELPQLIQGAGRYARGHAEPYTPPAPPPLEALRLRGVASELLTPRQEDPGAVPLPPEWKLMAQALEQGDNGNPKLPRGLHVFVGQTGGGKTQLATGFTRAALLAGHPVVYLSLELSRGEMAARVLALEVSHADDVEEDGAGKIWGPSWPILAQGKKMSQTFQAKTKAAVDTLGDALNRLYVWHPEPKPGDRPPSVDTLAELVAAVWRENERVPLVIVDHLQAPGLALNGDPSGRLPLRERIAGITMALRHISKESEGGWPGCPVVVLSLTGRANVSGKYFVPGFNGTPDDIRKADLETLKALPKEAGEIEATAVTVWAMASAPPSDEEVESAQRGQRPARSRMALRLAKARMNRPGKWIPLSMEGATGRLRDDPERYAIAQREDEQAAKKRQEAAKRKKEEERKKAEEGDG
jgi:hypothetical protein